MKLKIIKLTVLLLCFLTHVKAQQTTITLAQQSEDFDIFIGGLKEGHSGLYYFIDEKVFATKCDSIRKTFIENSSVETYYLKLRYLITLLCHGHTRISLPANGSVNYKMAVLDSTKPYLPFEFLIVNKQLLIKEDCSKEQLFTKYSVVKSIDGVSTKLLMNNMLQYIPADGINQTFKYYNLYNYFYFHYLYNLLYPQKNAFKIELENNRTQYYIQGLKAKEIDSIYKAKNNESISTYSKQLAYKSTVMANTGYLKVGSFYKGLIENFGQKYEAFLDSSFSDLKKNKTENLIVDIRNNEGGGDGYDVLLYNYLSDTSFPENNIIKVPGRNFKFNKYAVNLSDDVKGFIDNPGEFLNDDTSLLIKKQYVEMMRQNKLNQVKNQFKGRVFILTNGGSFSASTNFISLLYKYRNTTNRKILFVGEENGGDIYCNTECAGQGYKIKLPNSLIEVDMPFLCFGTLNKNYNQKRLPDFKVNATIKDLSDDTDGVIKFVLQYIKKKTPNDEVLVVR